MRAELIIIFLKILKSIETFKEIYLWIIEIDERKKMNFFSKM